MDELVDRVSGLDLSGNDPPSVSTNNGFFSPNSRLRRRNINKTVKRIKSEINATNFSDELGNAELGVIYAAKERGTNFTKIGYSKHDKGKRIQDINNCGVVCDKTYQTSTFACAHQAEQIIHDLLAEWAHERLNCRCGKKNREWYQIPFGSVITEIHRVFTWMMHQPYDLKTRKLKPDWVVALSHWHKSHQTTTPLSWAELFIMGLSLVPQSKKNTPRSSSLRKIASTSNISDAVSPSPQVRDRAKKKNPPPAQPPLLVHSSSSPATFRSDGPSGDLPLQGSVSKLRRPSNLNAELATSKALICGPSGASTTSRQRRTSDFRFDSPQSNLLTPGASCASTTLSGNSSVAKASVPEPKTLGGSNVECTAESKDLDDIESPRRGYNRSKVHNSIDTRLCFLLGPRAH